MNSIKLEQQTLNISSNAEFMIIQRQSELIVQDIMNENTFELETNQANIYLSGFTQNYLYYCIQSSYRCQLIIRRLENLNEIIFDRIFKNQILFVSEQSDEILVQMDNGALIQLNKINNNYDTVYNFNLKTGQIILKQIKLIKEIKCLMCLDSNGNLFYIDEYQQLQQFKNNVVDFIIYEQLTNKQYKYGLIVVEKINQNDINLQIFDLESLMNQKLNCLKSETIKNVNLQKIQLQQFDFQEENQKNSLIGVFLATDNQGLRFIIISQNFTLNSYQYDKTNNFDQDFIKLMPQIKLIQSQLQIDLYHFNGQQHDFLKLKFDKMTHNKQQSQQNILEKLFELLYVWQQNEQVSQDELKDQLQTYLEHEQQFVLGQNFEQLQNAFLMNIIKQNKQQLIIDTITKRTLNKELLKLEDILKIIQMLLDKESLFVQENLQTNYQRLLQILYSIHNQKVSEAHMNKLQFNQNNFTEQDQRILDICQNNIDKTKTYEFNCILDKWIQNTSIFQIYEQYFKQYNELWQTRRQKLSQQKQNNQSEIYNNPNDFYIDKIYPFKYCKQHKKLVQTYPISPKKIVQSLNKLDQAQQKFVIFYIFQEMQHFFNYKNQDEFLQFCIKFQILEHSNMKIFQAFSNIDRMIDFDQNESSQEQQQQMLAKEICNNIFQTKISEINENDKLHIIRVFNNLKLDDELFIMINSDINWDNIENAKLLLSIYLYRKNMLKSYLFVSSLTEYNTKNEKLSEKYTEIFTYFVINSIAQGMGNQLSQLVLNEFEKELLIQILKQKKNLQIYLCYYLLVNNQLEQSLNILQINHDFFQKNHSLEKIKTLYVMIQNILKIQPEFVQKKLQEKFQFLKEKSYTKLMDIEINQSQTDQILIQKSKNYTKEIYQKQDQAKNFSVSIGVNMKQNEEPQTQYSKLLPSNEMIVQE